MIRVPVAPGRNTNSVAVGIDNQKKVCAIRKEFCWSSVPFSFRAQRSASGSAGGIGGWEDR